MGGGGATKTQREVDFAWVPADRGTVQGFRKQRQRDMLILHGYPQRGSSVARRSQGDARSLSRAESFLP